MALKPPRPALLPRRHAGTLDPELAQRAVEYRGLAARLDVARAAVQPLPKWEKRTSLLLRRLAEKEVGGRGRALIFERLWCPGHGHTMAVGGLGRCGVPPSCMRCSTCC